MTVDSILLSRNFIDLDFAIQNAKVENVTAIDSKIQEIIQQLDKIHPELSLHISQSYKKADIRNLTTISTALEGEILSSPIRDRLHLMGQEILSAVSKTLPELNLAKKIELQKELHRVFCEAFKTGETEQLEKILNEPVDLNAVTPFGFSGLTGILKLSAKTETKLKFIKLLLQRGALISEENKKQLMEFLFLECNISLDDELFDLLTARGFNIITDGGNALKLLGDQMKGVTRTNFSLIFYGAAKYDDFFIETWETTELLGIRQEVLNVLNKSLPKEQQIDLSRITPSQSRLLASHCRHMYDFRTTWKKLVPAGDLQESPKSELNLDAHIDFNNACLEGDLETAEKIIHETTIDINAPLVRIEDKIFVPLLSYACIEGHLKLVEWLLKNGAEVNTLTTLPPILCAIAFPDPQQKAILELLLKAGADVNAKDAKGKSWIPRRGPFDFVKAVKMSSDPVGAIKTLVECGHDFDSQGIWFLTAEPKALIFLGIILQNVILKILIFSMSSKSEMKH